MSILLKKQQRPLVWILALNFLFIGSAAGQIVPGEISEPDEAEIFPFAEMASELRPAIPSDAKPGVPTGLPTDQSNYSEDLYEIRDDGVYDSHGNRITTLPSVREDSAGSASSPIQKPAIPMTDFESYRQTIIANWGGQKEFTQRRLEGIKRNLEEEMNRFTVLDREIKQLQDAYEPLRKTIETLKDHVNLLNLQLFQSEKKIQSAELQIAEKEIDLKKAMEALQKSQVRLDIQKDQALDYIRMVYEEEEQFASVSGKDSSTLKLLLADRSVSENLLGREYAQALEQTGREVFYNLFFQKKTIEERQQNIQRERENLNRLYASLDQERRLLKEGKEAKKILLEKTLGEEQRYQALLEESIKQQLESAIAIQNMKDNIDFIEQKLSLLSSSLENAAGFEPGPEKTAVLETMDAVRSEAIPMNSITPSAEEVISAVQPFEWPVPPVAVTAYFHDSTYPKRWGIHNAIDLRAKQNTEIRAPANAYVFQTRDNGMGYSYIILAHKNNLVTVYGHVAEILVKPGTVVKQGDLIGLTGGMPGTKGAGWQTTGPHLHFEVWHKGDPADPLDWLPVYELPIEYVPDRFLKANN